jgi:hypothetical protein
VLVHESEAGELQVHYRGERIAHQEIPAPARQKPPARSPIHVPYSRPRYRHGPEHPYNRRDPKQIKRQRLRQLKQAVAARAVVRACAAPDRAAVPAAPGSAPAPTTQPFHNQQGGHF